MQQQIPLYATVDYGPERTLSLDDYAPDIWDAMRGGFREGLKYSPIAAMNNWADTNPQYARGADFTGMTAEDAIDLAMEGNGLPDWHAKMPLGKQKQYIESMGLTGQVEPHEDMEERALKIICETKQEDNSLRELQKNMGWQHMPFSLAAGFAAGMIDPLAVASAFIPAIPEQRVISMLSRHAFSAAGRAGVRAVQGAANGALGAALLEPMVYAASQSLQRDYDFAMSLCNMSFGALMGAALHPVAGHVSEWLARRHGGWMPWEMGVSTEASDKLRVANEKLFEEVRMSANPSQDRAAVQRQAKADALTWDAHMRHIAFTEKIATEEAYARNPFAMFNAERFRQETAVNRGQIKKWAKEVQEQTALRQMQEQFPDLRIGDDLDHARERLEFWQAKHMESSRNARRDLDAMFTGESLFAKLETANGAHGENRDVSFQFRPPPSPGQTPAIMGAATFPVDGRAIVRIFEAHDFTTVSHELAHVLRRQYQKLASSPNASAALRKQYANMEYAFGVGEDGVWTARNEELFAESYVRYMLAGDAPSHAMAQSFAVMREQAAALYADADRAGVNISEEMRNVFASMLTTPIEKGDQLLREAIADLATRRYEHELLPRPSGPRKPGDAVGLETDPSPTAHAVEREGKSLDDLTAPSRGDDIDAEIEFLEQSTREIAEANKRALELDPNLAPQEKERIRQEWAAEDEALAREFGDMEEQGKAMEEYVHCLIRAAS